MLPQGQERRRAGPCVRKFLRETAISKSAGVREFAAA